jgi:carbamoyltransferase
MNIIGISAFYHDSACCLMQDGVKYAAEEERFSRIKHDPAVPLNAFRWCLHEAGLNINEIDRIAYYENPEKKLERQLWMHLQPGSVQMARKKITDALDTKRVEREFRECLGYEGRIEYFDHHLSHAASSYFFSGFA